MANQLYAIVNALEATYGSPRHGNPDDPLEDLLFIKLSQQTNEAKFIPVFNSLRARGWDWLVRAPEDEIATALRRLAFHRQRARQLKAMLTQIVHDRGALDLEWLKGLSPGEAVEYLESLPGIGIKSAYCVAMYTLDAQVLPVDTHVGRVAARLGLLPRAAEYKGTRVHSELENVVPPSHRYSFHVNAVSHGRMLCTTTKPKCSGCPLTSFCVFFKGHVRSAQVSPG